MGSRLWFYATSKRPLHPRRSHGLGAVTVTVRAGEILIVDRCCQTFSMTVSMRPHRYEALESQFVEPEIRSKGSYRGYHLVVERVLVDDRCRPLEAGA